MRKLSTISAPIINDAIGSYPYARRRISARQVTNALTCVMLFKHGEDAFKIQVSTDDDPVGAVWIEKRPILVDARNFGNCIVVTMSKTLARQHRLDRMPLLDFQKYLSEERAQISAACQAAHKARKYLMFGNSRVGLHPNATA